jgi:DNA polymerase-1
MTTLLIDADILVFKVASACQGVTNWGDGQYSTTADLNEAKALFRQKVAALKEGCDADKVVLALKGEGNFRRRILPTYKANRANLIPPMLRQPLMDWLMTHPQVVSRPGLEGDDVLGILATRRSARLPMPSDDCLIWSIDKDLKQIPGNHWTHDGVEVVTEDQADYQHMFQTLTGDATDNYKGLPGCGPVKAKRILDLELFNLGCDGIPMSAAWWRHIVHAFTKAGLSEADALVQARVARILRASDYDFTERKPILWQSPSSPAKI